MENNGSLFKEEEVAISSETDSDADDSQKYQFSAIKKDLYPHFKLKKIKFDQLKYFRRMHILAPKRRKEDERKKEPYTSDDEEQEEHSEDSDLDNFEFKISIKQKLS